MKRNIALNLLSLSSDDLFNVIFSLHVLVCKFKAHKRCAVRSTNNCKWTTLASIGNDIIEDEDGVSESLNYTCMWSQWYSVLYLNQCVCVYRCQCHTSGWRGTCRSAQSVWCAIETAVVYVDYRTGGASGAKLSYVTFLPNFLNQSQCCVYDPHPQNSITPNSLCNHNN